MGLLRKGLFLSTGGMSRVVGIRTNSKKERIAKALEKQNRAARQQRHVAAPSAPTRSAPLPPALATAIPPKSTVVDDLSKLADLWERGALTKEEFEEQKALLLGHQPPAQ